MMNAVTQTKSKQTEPTGLESGNGRETSTDDGAPPQLFETVDPSMKRVMALAMKVAPTDATILLLGESGTGKTVLAREIHRRSQRAQGAMVTVSCPSLSRELLESELFGHVRGAFTGAVKEQEGKVAAANGGTLFLDEIGDLPLEVQPKLLRLLQEHEFERLGETRARPANVRVISATNVHLPDRIRKGAFRQDLYYRLNIFTIQMPRLRERLEDLDRIAGHYLEFFSKRCGKRIKGFAPEARDAMRRHDWPGNLRELRNLLERAVILCDREQIGLEDIHDPAAPGGAETVPRPGDAVTLKRLEEEHIRLVMERSSTQQEAARILGVDPATLYRKRRRSTELAAVGG